MDRANNCLPTGILLDYGIKVYGDCSSCVLSNILRVWFSSYVDFFDLVLMTPFHQCDGSCGKKFPTIKLGLQFLKR